MNFLSFFLYEIPDLNPMGKQLKLLLLKIKRKYQIEDITIKIDNKIKDYDRETSDRLAYLKEQSAIARKLGIAKNTIETQKFNNQTTLLEVKLNSPFYLRGYEAIDKEIELIGKRSNKSPFIEGLFNLERKKREIEQNKIIERVKLALKSTLPGTNDEFSAASINAITTKFEYKNNIKMFVIAIAIGLIVGAFYVIIFNAIQSHRAIRKKTD